MLFHRSLTVFLVATLSTFSGLTLADACSPDCGKVVSVEAQQREGKGSGVGAVAGGVVGGLLGNQLGGGTGRTVATIGGVAGGAYVGNEVEKKSNAEIVHVVTVQMDSGDSRKFTYKQKPQFVVGDRTQVRKGKLERYTGK